MNKRSLLVRSFRWLSFAEGVSFLVLLFIAMPLKYMWDMPEYVSVVGMAHGILFVAYIFGAVLIYSELNMRLKTLAVLILCSVLPFGPFYADAKYLKPA